MSKSERFEKFIHQDTAKVWRAFGFRMGQMMAEMMERRLAEAMVRERETDESNEAFAWAVVYRDGHVSLFTGKPTLWPVDAKVVPLFRRPQPTLTDEEREGLHWAAAESLERADAASLWKKDLSLERRAAALRGLLIRTEGEQ